MTKHYILLSSSYTDGERIAVDFPDPKKIDEEHVREALDTIEKVCGKGAHFATHYLETESADWESVAAYDPYFKNVHCLETVEEFAQKIKHDLVLRCRDVVKYILCALDGDVTYLELKALVYQASEEYFKKTGQSLCVDDLEISLETSIQTNFVSMARWFNNKRKMSAISRILFATDGSNKFISMQDVVEKYLAAKKKKNNMTKM